METKYCNPLAGEGAARDPAESSRLRSLAPFLPSLAVGVHEITRHHSSHVRECPGDVFARVCRRNSVAIARVHLYQVRAVALGRIQRARVLVRHAVAAAYRIKHHYTRYAVSARSCRRSGTVTIMHLRQTLVGKAPGLVVQHARVLVRRAVAAAYRFKHHGTHSEAVLTLKHAGAPHSIIRRLLAVIVLLPRRSCRGETVRDTDDGY
eukprot:CAMPEP_0194279672 /NCGR_PEP_ID=MMETSP0169-20130528/14061_1 /TAXON_ID=218684 /ORGANISM="Corethron pennatum, Strain L29A3" /LENGTH=206 /DNA_ID=CAMNT_0039024125 /DNA_START=275 /DNA_END=895 /DNA_ORIENTATION=+